jgi:hypothetical protein
MAERRKGSPTIQPISSRSPPKHPIIKDIYHGRPGIAGECGGNDPHCGCPRLPSDRARGATQRDDGRLARVIDRARVLGGKARQDHLAIERAELRLIPKRIRLINGSILFAALSALAVCLVIVLLFVSSLIDLHIGIAVALTFIVSMLLLMGALISFIAEIRVALSVLYVANEALVDDEAGLA